ncbi:penicillin acylase family protein [Actinoplanes sp. NBRC 103695]|uniref:penicillin acylase family protein n=1 Tax=Actinoplanes sp. NBRC 103695 TaxID=3032202 RepID=UPI002556DC2B|nr:penicillin acylase family protein [Actinoplanes sp. NBRC 103695]
MTSAIYRDEWGIPHLVADSVSDLAFLQGRAAARDRAWQIEVERRRSEGRLAEWIGAAEVGWDRFARRVRLDDTARQSFAKLDAPTRSWVQAYVDGVNSSLADADAPEFVAHDVRPEPWHPWTPLGIFLVQHILFGTFPSKMWRAHVASAVGVLKTPADPLSGSNAWAVAGEYIAGDPHRILELPGVYQQVHLTCPEFDVAGFAFPGVPGVPHFGHAGSVAWAITNAMADYQDLYQEELRRSGDSVQARGASGWEQVSRHVETITVRDAPAVEVEVIETPRGPIIDRDLALRVPARVEFELGFGALLPLLRAKTVDDVVNAVACWVEPVNSVVAMDSSGTLVSLVAGKVPLRDDRVRQVPVPAWEPRYEWQGYAPLPRSVREVVVNANDSRPDDTAELGNDFALPARANRIAALLLADTPPASIHTDVLAAPDLFEVLSLISDHPLAARLLAWDRRMEPSSVDAGLFAAWRHAAVELLASSLPELFTETGYDPLFAPWLDPRQRLGRALPSLITPDIARAALDVVTPGPTWGSSHVLAPVVVVPETALRSVVELPGDNDCVRSTSSVVGVTDACWKGSVARYVWELTDKSESRWVVPFGASGRPDDPHFADQLPLWVAGDLVPVFPAQLTVEETLQPAANSPGSSGGE